MLTYTSADAASWTRNWEIRKMKRNYKNKFSRVIFQSPHYRKCHLSMFWADRSSLWPHSASLVLPPLCTRRHTCPPGCHSICCRQLCYRCSWLLSRSALRCSCLSGGPKSASTPWGSWWPCGRAWHLLGSRDLQKGEKLQSQFHSLLTNQLFTFLVSSVYLSSLDENPR